ncbi:MAG: AbrB/MazE/SpoVT family DNA-binding domain-containing protein [Chloroflexota bacterium]
MREHLTRVTRKGQITVPVEVRRALGLQEGDNVAVLLEDGRVTLERRPGAVERTAGALRSMRPALTPDQEQAAFEQGVAASVRQSLER